MDPKVHWTAPALTNYTFELYCDTGPRSILRRRTNTRFPLRSHPDYIWRRADVCRTRNYRMRADRQVIHVANQCTSTSSEWTQQAPLIRRDQLVPTRMHYVLFFAATVFTCVHVELALFLVSSTLSRQPKYISRRIPKKHFSNNTARPRGRATVLTLVSFVLLVRYARSVCHVEGCLAHDGQLMLSPKGALCSSSGRNGDSRRVRLGHMDLPVLYKDANTGPVGWHNGWSSHGMYVGCTGTTST